MWVELSSAAGLAGHRAVGDVDGPVVCIATSSGFKDRAVGREPHDPVAPEWDVVRRYLADAGIG